jgi:hypothetical protein
MGLMRDPPRPLTRPSDRSGGECTSPWPDKECGKISESGGLAGARGDLDADQPGDVGADDLADAPLDLGLGLVVAPAEAACDAAELLFGLGERALPGGGELARVFGGVDVGDAEATRLAGLGIVEVPVGHRAAVARALRGGRACFALGDVAQRPQALATRLGQVALLKARRGSERRDEEQPGPVDLTLIPE